MIIIKVIIKYDSNVQKILLIILNSVWIWFKPIEPKNTPLTDTILEAMDILMYIQKNRLLLSFS